MFGWNLVPLYCGATLLTVKVEGRAVLAHWPVCVCVLFGSFVFGLVSTGRRGVGHRNTQ